MGFICPMDYLELWVLFGGSAAFLGLFDGRSTIVPESSFSYGLQSASC
jgi:hypothetical protein